ncbi:MAG: ABC transporter ATP-binding protein [Spirochaetaceae bacterium]|nr:MAG: ABC transporter ATP-binding protein [Spirochaetaceae bacterium]
MLQIRNVYKRFNLEAGFFAREELYVYAVNGVSLTVGDNEIYGLVGESGCGKTTTARLAVRMYRADAGSIIFTDGDGNSHNVDALDNRGLHMLRSKIQYIFQDPARSLNPRMDILEILTAGYRYSPFWPGRKRAREEAEAVMLDVGLQPSDLERRAADFSGGQRQRISIARALMARPELLICDEVVSALDVSIQGQILNLLLKLKEEYKLAMLFIAHDLAVVSYVSDRIGVMYRGLMMEEAPSQELIADRLHPYTRHLYSAIPQVETHRAAQRALQAKFRDQPDPTRPPVGITPSMYESNAYAGGAGDATQMDEVSPGHRVSRHFNENGPTPASTGEILPVPPGR